MSILETNEIKHIITTGPPHSVHLIGRGLKLRNPALSWIADFRDPWTEWTILKRMLITKPIWNIHKRQEHEVLKMADVTLATSPTAVEEFKSLGARKVISITNGYDVGDYSVSDRTAHTETFKMSYVGMLSKERSPEVLWRLLDELCAEASFQERFRLNITGIISPIAKDQIENLPHLSPCTQFQDSVDHEEVFNLYANSDLLLLLQSREEGSFSQLPGKLFEYLGANRRILALGYEGSDIDKILTETKAGQLFEYDDSVGIKTFILSIIESRNETNSQNVGRFERKALTQDLAKLLDTL